MTFLKSHIFINNNKNIIMRTIINIFDFAFFAAEEDYFFGGSIVDNS